MYVIVIKTPANDNPKKMVDTFYVGFKKERGIMLTDWDEDIKFAYRFVKKIDAKKVQSYLRTLKGSEKARIRFAQRFSKN